MTTSPLSRRHALANAMRLFAAVGVSLAATDTARAQSKVPQKIAGYQDQSKDQHRCAICAHFTPPASCQIVDGQISPNGWCKLFSPKI